MIRSSLIGLGLVAVAATPALAAHTQDAVIYDTASGVVRMVVVPSDDSELTDPAMTPPGTAMVRVAHVDGRDQIAAARAIVPSIMGPIQTELSIAASLTAVASASLSQCLSTVECAASLSTAALAATTDQQ